MLIGNLSYHPVIQRAVVLKLQCTDRMSYPFNGIFNRMREIIHRINTPCITGIVMGHMSDTVNNRISHINIGRCHIYFCTEYLLTIFIFSGFHFLKQLQIFLCASVSVRTLLTGFCQRSSVFPDFLRCQIADICFPFLYQLYCSLIHLLKITRRKKQTVSPVCPQPFHICFNGLHKFKLLFGRICIIKTQIKFSVIFLSQSII